MYHMITREGLFATIGDDKLPREGIMGKIRQQQLADKIKLAMESLGWRAVPEREGTEILQCFHMLHYLLQEESEAK